MLNNLEVCQPAHRDFELEFKGRLKLHGMWRGKLQDAQNINLGRYYSFFLCGWFPFNFVLVALYIKENINEDVYTLAEPVTDLFLFILGTVLIVICQTEKFERQMELFYNQIHVVNYAPRDEYVLGELHITEERCRLVYLSLNWLFVLGCIFYDSVPVVNNIISGAFQSDEIPRDNVQYLWLPFDYKYDNTNWLYANILFSYNTFTLSYVIIYINVIMICILIHTVTNLRILKHRLAGLSEYVSDTKVMMTQAENYEITNKMRELHHHHLLLLDSLELFKDFFGPAVLAAFTYDTVALCVLLLLLLRNPINFIRYGGLSVAVVGQLAGHSYAMEELSSSVEELRLALFEVPWYAMNMKNQRAISIMVTLCQIPFDFEAAGVVRVNMQAMATIMKSSLSYFIWLKTMGSESQ